MSAQKLPAITFRVSEETRQKISADLETLERAFQHHWPQYEAMVNEIEREMEAVRARIATIGPIRPLNPVSRDLITILGPGWSDDRRLAAARRIAKKLGNVIHPKRWEWIKPKLKDLARQHRRSERAELESLLVDRLFEAVQVAGQYVPAAIGEALEAIRSQLNGLLTADLLGPEWRKKTGASKLKEVALEERLTLGSLFAPSSLAQMETRLAVESLLSRAALTNREREVLFARVLENTSYDLIAAKLRVKAVTVRVLYANALKKLKKIS